MAQKPSIPKGTRDFSPEQMRRRNHIFSTIRGVFNRYGYQPIETPAMENLSTLLGKYGDEGDRLLFKVLNSGEFTSSLSPELLQPGMVNRAALAISEKGLRYDLTVPFARFVVQNQASIHFPFKRYQIQPVWRADRPQKGRYREFYQCDADVIGSKSMFNELELVLMVDEVFQQLNIRTAIKINNRKVLYGIAEHIGHPDRLIDITVAIDKLEKIGAKAVMAELQSKGIDAEACAKLLPIIGLRGSASEQLDVLRPLLEQSEVGKLGMAELDELFGLIAQAHKAKPLHATVELDLSLARGLNYYTGAIFEVKALDAQIGSICGGGRYDDLTGIFGLKGVSGVGISFGADRIYDVMQQLDLFGQTDEWNAIMVANFGEAETLYSMSLLRQCDLQQTPVLVYPDTAKLKKQLDYANALRIPYVLMAGDAEMAQQQITLKDMTTGQQTTIAASELASALNAIIEQKQA